MDYLESLNEEQKSAVTFEGKHALVIAGAGTGKTRTIIHRAMYLLSQGVRPDKILILSFTRKSAREIVERIKSSQQSDAPVFISGQTFHSWCANIIKNNPGIFEQSDYTLIDPEDVESLFKIIFNQKYKRIKTIEPKLYTKINQVYSYSINTRKTIEESIRLIICSNMFDNEKEEYIKENLLLYKEVMKEYIEYKKQNKVFDYDDLLYITANALQQSSQAREFIASKYSHILVDEFQDTNPLQYQLLESFYEQCNLFCVGDDAQSIYGFRGADFKSMYNFTNAVPDSKKLYLNINYRSTQEILDISNWLLHQSPFDYNKELKAERGSGIKPCMEYVYDDYAEANMVTEKMQKYYIEKNMDYKSHIVLSRTVFGLRQVEASCVVKKIPYKIYGGSSLIKSRHIRDVLSAMRIVSNIKDQLAWNRYLQLFSKIGQVSASNITSEMVLEDYLPEALEKLYKKKIDSLAADVLDGCLMFINSPAEMIEFIVKSMEGRFKDIYKDEWDKWRKQDFAVLEEIAKNADSAAEFISEYILDPSLESTVNNMESLDDYVILSTIHSAKGLEADVCHILNVTPYSYPSKRAVADGEESIEEERRCLYVALTRAKNELILYNRYSSISGYGGLDNYGINHYFFNELDDSLISLGITANKTPNLKDKYTGEKIKINLDWL